jgi:DNA-binding transcriptional regulator of glucitol operon
VRRVLTLNWVLLHLLVVAAVLVMLRLGLWQWHRAHEGGGGIQNYAYAFQWPVFAVFALTLWAKTIHEELKRDSSPDGDGEASRQAAPDAPVVRRDGEASRQAAPDAPVVRQPGVRIGLTTEVVAADAHEDPAVAAWNARLAALNAASAAAESRRRR